MWNVPAVFSLIPCRNGSDRSGDRKSHYRGPTFWAVTWQPVGRFMCSWMRWKALSELYAAVMVCQWCHVTLPPSSKAQSSRCGFELKAHIHYVQCQYYREKQRSTLTIDKSPAAPQCNKGGPRRSCIPHHKRLPIQRFTKPQHDKCTCRAIAITLREGWHETLEVMHGYNANKFTVCLSGQHIRCTS